MKITKRDYKIMDFLNICPSTSFIIHDYLKDGSLQVIQRRLKLLSDYGYIKRTREDINKNYIYFMDRKPKQLDHVLKLSELYCFWTSKNYEIIKFKREVLIHKGIKPDAIAIIQKGTVLKLFIIEVDIYTNPSEKLNKYREYYISKEYEETFPVMPTLLFITDKKVSSNTLDINRLPLNFYNNESF